MVDNIRQRQIFIFPINNIFDLKRHYYDGTKMFKEGHIFLKKWLPAMRYAGPLSSLWFQNFKSGETKTQLKFSWMKIFIIILEITWHFTARLLLILVARLKNKYKKKFHAPWHIEKRAYLYKKGIKLSLISYCC